MPQASPWPSVTIVMTYYNEGPLFERALRSALEQDYAGPIDIVVVDDCSTVPVPPVNLPLDRVRFFRQPTNTYAAAARNRGVREATGEFVAFLDSDDEYLPFRVRHQMEMFRDHPELVHVGSSFVCHNGDSVKVHYPLAVEKYFPGELDVSRVLPADYAQWICSEYAGYCTLCMTMRRQTYLDCGGMREDLRWGEEWEMQMRLARFGPTGYVATPDARYLMRPGTITSTNNPWKYDSMAQIYRQARKTPGIPRDEKKIARAKEREAWLLASQQFLEDRRDSRNAFRCARRALLCGPNIWAVRSTIRTALHRLRG